MAERRACTVLGQHRSTQRKRPQGRPDEDALTTDVIRLASRYGRYGYRRITALLRSEGWRVNGSEGWRVNAKRVQRIWRREGLKVPQKQPKRGRLWLNDGSCIRLRAKQPNHVWSYDFVLDRTHDGKAFRMLTVIDEFTRQCLAIHVDRKLNSQDVLECISALFVRHGPPDYIRSDNGAEFTARAVRGWLNRIGVKTLFIEPGSPWENGYNESFFNYFALQFVTKAFSSSSTAGSIAGCVYCARICFQVAFARCVADNPPDSCHASKLFQSETIGS